MPQSVRFAFNCVVVAGLTWMGIRALLLVPTLPIAPTHWASQYFDTGAVMGLWFIYTVILWAIPGALIAWCMMALRPRFVGLYALTSALTFIVTMQSWHQFLGGNAFSYLRELMFVLTIPFLFWLFNRVSQNRHETPSGSGASSAAVD